jgi:hypothetical protein
MRGGKLDHESTIYEGVVGDIVTYAITVYKVNNGYFNFISTWNPATSIG